MLGSSFQDLQVFLLSIGARVLQLNACFYLLEPDVQGAEVLRVLGLRLQDS